MYQVLSTGILAISMQMQVYAIVANYRDIHKAHTQTMTSITKLTTISFSTIRYAYDIIRMEVSL